MRANFSVDHLKKYWDKVSDIWDKFHVSYPKMEEFHKAEENIICEILLSLKNKYIKILDLGCGTGRVLRILENKGFKKLYGIDISGKMIKKSKQTLSASVNLLLHDFRKNIPFTNESFNMVTATANSIISGIQHPENVVKEVFRVLKKNGTFIVGVYNAKYLTTKIVDNYYKKLPKEIGFTRFDKKNHVVHFKGYYSKWLTTSELGKILKSANFKEVKIKKVGIGLIGIAIK